MNKHQFQPHTYCSYCGQAYGPNAGWPRRCTNCDNMTFRNPIPVAVVLQPVDNGVLTVRRTIEPRSGWLALPGGYVDWGETWQEAGAREMWEEAGVRINPNGLREFKVFSASNATMMIVAYATPLNGKDLPPFIPNEEADKRAILTEPQELAFPLHTEVLTAFLGGRLFMSRPDTPGLL